MKVAEGPYQALAVDLIDAVKLAFSAGGTATIDEAEWESASQAFKAAVMRVVSKPSVELLHLVAKAISAVFNNA